MGSWGGDGPLLTSPKPWRYNNGLNSVLMYIMATKKWDLTGEEATQIVEVKRTLSLQKFE